MLQSKLKQRKKIKRLIKERVRTLETIPKTEEGQLKVEDLNYELSKLAIYIKNRDNNTCQLCKLKLDKVLLHNHHILPKSQYPKHIINKSNMITICVMCHGYFMHRDFKQLILHKPKSCIKKSWLLYLKQWKDNLVNIKNKKKKLYSI